jgi:beta-carotene 3-hydroxylase
MTTYLWCALITVGAFLAWELVAWWTHKYVMHGILWTWHKSHHTAHDHALERNDLFGVVFSLPSIALFYYGSVTTYNPYLIACGLGILCYGIFYVVFHDVIVHQRIRWRPGKRSRYLERMINAHYVHHSRHTKDGCEAFGFLYAPKKYAPKKLILKETRTETQ